ncbi:2-hydroxychromene-2-carboxylate isomerase [Streptomyces sp. CBMA152]|uniref:2-hydroxychromene-2-carboxylate isomerase n=1 Tax=Streptomyces sp. CBMA152 TaxID=1896312 RepID=UPI00166136B7|nr:DsbA family protein [Streptomyces sp. CBMA152]MBD0743107.1 disulfide bond formation protein DsbA [Streptomyces sp. CBMA152]
MSRRPARPVLYFSFRSPYSWLALRDLEARFPQAPEVVEYRPWWEPDGPSRKELDARGAPFPYIPMSKAKHLYILQDVKRLTEARGIKVSWPVDIDPWWEVPHLAWLAARRLGQDRRLLAALVAARWERGANICDPGVLRAVAEEAGLDPAPLVGAVDDPAIRAEGLDCLQQVHEDDAFGIPYFTYGRRRYWGLDRLDGFLRDVTEAGLGEAGTDTADEDAEKSGLPVGVLNRIGAYDHDTAGGCG